MLATTLLPGCYRYAPIAGTRADEGIEVRVRLTDTGAIALAPMIGVQVESVGGRIVAAADSAFTLAITETTNRAGATTSWSGERVVVPRAAVAELERRALDRRRSTIGGGLLVAAVAIAITTFDLTGSGGGSARSGGGGSPR